MNYLEIIKQGFLAFPLIALIFTLPYIITQYRKYGSVPFIRVIIVYSFILYLICAYFLVILPLPPKEIVDNLKTPEMQIIPFKFIEDIITQTPFNITNPSTYLPTITSTSCYQVLYNILLFMPFGIYLRYYFKCSLKKTITLSFLLSLSFELTQLTGLYGIYSRSYRLFDVDDLMINTVGGIIGYQIGKIFLKILPSRDKVDEYAYEKGTQIPWLRRTFALIIDLIFLIITYFIINTQNLNQILEIIISISIYYILLPYLLKGQTIGKKILKIHLVTEDETIPKPHQYLLRYGILYLIYIPLPFYLLYLINNLSQSHILQITIIIFIPLYYLIIFIKIIKRKKLLYEKISKTKNQSTISYKNE